MKTYRKIALATLAAPLTLGLAACGSNDAAPGEVAEGEAIEPIAAPEGQQWTDVVTVTEDNGYMMGNPDAPLKLIEYASHTCGGCALFSQQGGPALKDGYVSTGVVSFELRNLVRDPIDLVIATMARCGAKESFIPLADQAWANFEQVMGQAQANNAAIQSAINTPEEERYVAIAEAAGLIDFFSARGLPADQARQCLADTDNVKAIAERSTTQANELGINQTPTFLLNGSKIDAAQWPQLEPLLQRAGAR